MAEKKTKQEEDPFTNLPEELKLKVLSYLPSESVVKTCLLSKKWKNLWTKMIALDFEIPRHEDTHFSRFVQNVFRVCNISKIEKLKLHAVMETNKSATDACLSVLSNPDIREVDINIPTLPLTLFQCSSLVILKMEIPYPVYGDIYEYEFNLPNLKVLQVVKNGNHAKYLLEELIRCCPNLEELRLIGCLGYEGQTGVFNLYAPKLKNLWFDLWGVGNCDVQVEAPQLEEMYVNEYVMRCHIMGEFHSLLRATLKIGKIYRTLRILYKTMEREIVSSGSSLPIFKHVKTLHTICSDHIFWEFLPHLLSSALNLEYLYIKQVLNPTSWPFLNQDVNPEITWLNPVTVPKCMLLHLSVIKIQNFQGRYWENEFLKYMLGNSKVLKALKIHCQGWEECAEKMDFFSKLLKFPKASKQCSIGFTAD